MSSVIAKKKKTLLDKILEKVKKNILPSEQGGINCDIPLADVWTDDEEKNTIISRRSELKTILHGNSDAVITFNS
jgi:hypothetical protein